MAKLFALILSLIPVKSYAACTELSPALLDEIVKKEGEKKLVFFSSWCSTCKDHLRPDAPQNTMFIGVFDKVERAQSALNKFVPGRKCYFDSGVAKKLGVKVVPAERVYSLR